MQIHVNENNVIDGWTIVGGDYPEGGITVDEIPDYLEPYKYIWKNNKIQKNPEWVDPIIISQEDYNIYLENQSNLQQSDYKAIKFAEGQLTEQEYAPEKELRQTYRDNINTICEKYGLTVSDIQNQTNCIIEYSDNM